jgi:hypothetical protein
LPTALRGPQAGESSLAESGVTFVARPPPAGMTQMSSW